MIELTKIFMAYAEAFEQTYIDDDWTRLQSYFAEDATYEVRGGPLACKLEGREAILKGLKRSVDTLDRRCDDRKIDVTSAPEFSSVDEGDQLSIDWYVSYQYKDAPRAGFPGRSVATVADGVIIALRDEYSDEKMKPFIDWMAQYGNDLDGAYV